MQSEFDDDLSEKPAYSERQAARQRRQARTRKIVIGVAAAAMAIIVIDVVLEEGFGFYLLFRSREQWEMVTFPNDGHAQVYSAVYYTGHVQKNDAERLRDYFQKAGLFAVPHMVTLVLSRSADAYIVSFFIAEGHFHDAALIAEMNEHRARISGELFSGEKVIVQLCKQTVIPAGSHPQLIVVRVLNE